MEYRTLGRTGLEISCVGFGGAVVGIPNYLGRHDPTAAADIDRCVAALHRALDLGLNFLDTAPGYGKGLGEEIYGRVTGERRSECVISTKCGPRDPDGIRRSCEESLARLRTDVIDVYQFHGSYYGDEEADRILAPGGGLEAMEALRNEGLVRFLGITAEGPSAGLSRLLATGRLDVLQTKYNLLYQHACDLFSRAGLMFEAEAQGMGITLMRPLASGVMHRLLATAAPELLAQLDLHALMLRYVLSNRLVDAAIVGMRTVEEVERNVELADDAAGRFDLDALHHRVFGEEANG